MHCIVYITVNMHDASVLYLGQHIAISMQNILSKFMRMHVHVLTGKHG